jgi:hypothetical protein
MPMSVRVTTTDLYESSFLASCGMSLCGVRVDRGKLKPTVVFAFEGNGRLEELQRAYHTGSATVNVAEFRHHLARLRRRMYAALSNQQSQRNRDHELHSTCPAHP